MVEELSERECEIRRRVYKTDLFDKVCETFDLRRSIVGRNVVQFVKALSIEEQIEFYTKLGFKWPEVKEIVIDNVNKLRFKE